VWDIPSYAAWDGGTQVRVGNTAAWSLVQLAVSDAPSPGHLKCCLTQTCSCLLHLQETEDQNWHWNCQRSRLVHCSKLEDWVVSEAESDLRGDDCPSEACEDLEDGTLAAVVVVVVQLH